MVDYVKALIFPFTSKQNVLNYVIGSVITILSFTIIPIFFLLGYLVRIIQHSVQEKEEMPGWNLPIEMLKHGLSAFLVLVAYLIVPLLIGVLGVQSAGSVDQVILNPELLSTVPSYSIALVFISAIISVIVLFILPMAVIRYAATENIKEAFNFLEILARLRKRLFGYIITYAITLLTFLISVTVLFVPFAQIIGAFVFFFAMVFVIHTFSQIYLEAENL